jgi:hypothetical protein
LFISKIYFMLIANKAAAFLDQAHKWTIKIEKNNKKRQPGRFVILSRFVYYCSSILSISINKRS